ncbi:MAG: sigma 54-interacting transcriptional regulator [Vicinamibacterales bacterium]
MDEYERERGLSSLEQLARAELLALTGTLNPARRIAAAFLLKQHQPTSERSVAHEILGYVDFKKGNFEAGTAAYEAGIHEAHKAGDPAIAARLQVRLVRKLARYLGPDQALTQLSAAHRLVQQAAEPSVSVEFQLALAELDAKRGLLQGARSHLTAAKALCALAPEAALECDVTCAEIALSGLMADVPATVTLAQQALVLAERTGNSNLHFAAVVNLGHFLTASGAYSQAKEVLDRALWRHASGGGAEIAIRDTLAELALAQQQDDELQRQCEAIDRLTSLRTSPASIYALWHVLTRVRWLVHSRRYLDAIEIAHEALPLAAQLGERLLHQRLQLAAAEALALAGKLRESETMFASATLSEPTPPPDVVAEIQRVAGRLAAASGRNDTALAFFAHAARLAAGMGHETARQEISRNAGTLQLRGGGQASEASPWLSPVCPPYAEGEMLSAVEHPRCHEVAARVGISAANVLSVAGHSHLLGREVMDILSETGAASEITLASRKEDGRWVPVAWSRGMSSTRAAAILTNSNAVTLPLELVPRPALVVYALPTQPTVVVALQRLVRDALTLHSRSTLDAEEVGLPPSTEGSEHGLVCVSESMHKLMALAQRVAATDVTVLITGETGTGKELLAQAIHGSSPRRSKAFVPFNCTAVPREMLDSQLFGYRRGAFTGASEPFDGVIRAASGGTLFLDEVGEVPMDVQPKLLRFLESGEIHPLGESRPKIADVRVVAATNAPLDQLVRDGRFREDLYYRLNVVRLSVPPLRDRREEIPPLVDHYLARWSREYGKQGLRIAGQTMEFLMLFSWPGNVRQLSNEIRRVVALADNGAVLMPEHLSNEIARTRRTVPATNGDAAGAELVVRMDQPLAAAVEHLERAMVGYAMSLAGSRVDDAAKVLGLSRKGLYLKRQRLGLA